MQLDATPHFPSMDSLVRGMVFSIFSEIGPEAILYYPLPEDSILSFEKIEQHQSIVTQRNYMQVAIKSISLLLTDFSYDFMINPVLEQTAIFGILPYPDMKSLGLTFFTYYNSSDLNRCIPATLTLYVHEDHRAYIYDAFQRLKPVMQQFTRQLIQICLEKRIYSELDSNDKYTTLIPTFQAFFSQLYAIQIKPISPMTANRRIRILCTGLENTGKTSFLLTIKREFSELPSLLPTTEPIQERLDFLGSTIIKWDIPGKASLREEVLKHADIYLYDTDLVYYFIDIKNPRLMDSIAFLKRIIASFTEYQSHIPFIFIITKVDEDIAESPPILQLIAEIKAQFSKIAKGHPYEFFTTSIFSLYSILTAFSYGLRLLSPNREMIEHVLHDFLLEGNLTTGLLANENGLVIAAQDIRPQDSHIIMTHSQIFEIAAPQFTMIAQQLAKYDIGYQNQWIKYQFSDHDLILLRRFQIGSFPLFALFYTTQTSAVEYVEKKFDPSFIDRITSLLTLYIS